MSAPQALPSLQSQQAPVNEPVHLLLVEDEPAVARLVVNYFKGQGIPVQHALDASSALELLKGPLPDLVLLDLGLPDRPGQELLAELKELHPHLPVVVTTGLREAEAALGCLRAGASDFLTKPFSLAEVHSVVLRELQRRRLQQQAQSLGHWSALRGFDRLVGTSAALLQARQALAKAAPLDINVLITGETGTGKDLAALAVHEASPRHARPFIALDCGALPDRLIESELFGYEKGAFTGADARKRGRLEIADGGTVFLDEIGNLSPAMQAKLLRVLQERCFKRVGGAEDVRVDVRVIAATNTDLAGARAKGQFREDLFFRIAEFHVALPPLRMRGADILELARVLLARDAVSFDRSLPSLGEGVAEALQRYPWPGNVRELRHALRQALLRCGRVLELRDLPHELGGEEDPGRHSSAPGPLEPRLKQALALMEKMMIQRALGEFHWNRQEAAVALGVDVKTLYNKMKSHGLG